jgi:hypothetical protein
MMKCNLYIKRVKYHTILYALRHKNKAKSKPTFNIIYMIQQGGGWWVCGCYVPQKIVLGILKLTVTFLARFHDAL